MFAKEINDTESSSSESTYEYETESSSSEGKDGDDTEKSQEKSRGSASSSLTASNDGSESEYETDSESEEEEKAPRKIQPASSGVMHAGDITDMLLDKARKKIRKLEKSSQKHSDDIGIAFNSISGIEREFAKNKAEVGGGFTTQKMYVDAEVKKLTDQNADLTRKMGEQANINAALENKLEASIAEIARLKFYCTAFAIAATTAIVVMAIKPSLFKNILEGVCKVLGLQR